MEEYIERDSAAAFAYNCGAVYVSNRLSNKNAFPAADVAPVRHGRWVKLDKHDWACSVCKIGVPYAYTGYNYCPRCGAKMDLELGYSG